MVDIKCLSVGKRNIVVKVPNRLDECIKSVIKPDCLFQGTVYVVKTRLDANWAPEEVSVDYVANVYTN